MSLHSGGHHHSSRHTPGRVADKIDATTAWSKSERYAEWQRSDRSYNNNRLQHDFEAMEVRRQRREEIGREGLASVWGRSPQRDEYVDSA